MSERTEVLVSFPLARVPSQAERNDLLKQAFVEARKLIGPGRVLGIASVAVGTHRLTSQPTLLVKLAVEAPEALQPSKRVLATR